MINNVTLIKSLGKYQQHLLDVQSANYKYNVLMNSLDYINAIVKSGEFEFLPISQDVNNIYTNNNYFYEYLESKILFIDNPVLESIKNRIAPQILYRFNSNLDYLIRINNQDYIISKNNTPTTHRLIHAKSVVAFADLLIDWESPTIMQDIIDKTGMTFSQIHLDIISKTKILSDIYYKGYNKLNVEALLNGIYDPDWTYIIHDDLYMNLNAIYSKFFSNISDYSMYSVVYNNFKIDTLNPTNYVKVCFNKELRTDLSYKIAYFYIMPMYNFARVCAPQILTSIKRATNSLIPTELSTQFLKINEISNIEQSIKDFILANIFNNMRFNGSYIADIRQSIDLSGLGSLFNNYIDKLSKNHFSKCLNVLYREYIQEFAYLMMTYGRSNDLVNFNVPEHIYKNMIYATQDEMTTEDRTVINLLNTEKLPSIFFRYIIKNNNDIDEIHRTVYFLRFNNANYKIFQNFMPVTFNIINFRLKSDVGYNKKLANMMLDENSKNIFEKTGYRLNELVDEVNNTNFYTPPLIKIITQKNSISKTLNNDILKRTSDVRSLVTITYKFRKNPLHFINSNLAAFSDWTDLILDTQYDNIDYIKPLSENDIKTIIGSIDINVDKLEEFINSSWINHFVDSKLIDLNVYAYVGDLVNEFSQTDSFKKYILKTVVEPTAAVLKTQAPKLYKEIYQNIDSIINYIKYLLVNQIVDTSDLANKYRNLVIGCSISNINKEILKDLISSFKNIDSVVMEEYQNESVKFVTSMAVLSFLDEYIDGFRLEKKFGKKSDYFRS